MSTSVDLNAGYTKNASASGELEHLTDEPSAAFVGTDAPVSWRERLPVLDLLRGFALLGILAVNIEDFAGPEGLHDIPIGVAKAAFVGWHAHLDVVILAIKWMFIEGKMRALFAMLYGAGCVLLAERLERRAGASHARTIFLRRNALLLLFGLIHGTLIWTGDILTYYASCGLLLPLLLRRIDGRKLIALGLILWLVAAVLGIRNFADAAYPGGQAGHAASELSISRFTEPASPAQRAAFAAADHADVRKMNEDAAASAAKTRTLGYLEARPAQAGIYFDFFLLVLKSGWILEIVGEIILGMGLYKVGWIIGRWSTRAYVRAAVIGYAICIPTVLIGVWQSSRYGFSVQSAIFWIWLPYCFQQCAGAIANASLLMVLAHKGWLRPLLDRLGAVGRTAFSNYILTSLLCQFLFVWGPWKLYGTLEYYQQIYVIAGVWAINLVASPIWLRHFAFGPLEWVWRSLTYWRRQPFRLAESFPKQGERSETI